MTNIIPIAYHPDTMKNYAYYVRSDFGGLLVDAGDFRTISTLLDKNDFPVDYILLTHEHQDHIKDAKKLKSHYQAKIIAHHELVPDLNQIDAKSLGLTYLHTPGHTELSGLWLFDQQSRPVAIFAGDVIFSCGSGRQFQGIDERLVHAMQMISGLDDDYLLCTGHEYTKENIEFCLQHFAEDSALLAYQKEVLDLLTNGKPTMPIRLGKEKTINPFLRFHEKAILKALNTSDPTEFLIKLRTLRDNF